MARIADALKKAEAERRVKARLSGLTADTAKSPRGIAELPSFQWAPKKIDIAPPPAVVESTSPPVDWDVHPSLVTMTDRGSTVAEQYRAARTWLLSRLTPGQRSCLAITSSVPREGKSVTTANLAIAMAEVRHLQVLAIDCDLRQGSLGKLFKLPAVPGLTEVLTGRASLDEAVRRTPIGNLSVVTAGLADHPNPTELLSSTQTSRLFDEIRARFHFVLVDTPAVQRVSDVGVIGSLCTGVVMVVRMHETAAHVVRQSLRCLQSNNLNILGCIAAACRPDVDRYADTAGDREE